jgi:phospholipid/cholesterol/gamma-HCH transport system substrate-binding protein
VNNTNGIVTGIRAGRGTAGMLLEDNGSAAEVRQAITNTRQATANLDRASGQVNDLLADFRSRDLFQKTEDTLNNARSASQQVDQVSQQLNTTLTSAFGEDQFGENAGSNLRQSLSNINQASGNFADDSEALKHEFFFRGFFKHRGYYTLNDLPVNEYRSGELFKKVPSRREWLSGAALFQPGPGGPGLEDKEILSPGGREQVDEVIGQLADIYSTPLLIEGYSEAGTPAERLVQSRQRAILLRGYLQIHFHLQPKNIGIIALGSTPPSSAGKSTWDGVCLVLLPPSK